MEKVLITGGAGFIGSYVVERLYTDRRYDIIVLDNFSKQIHGENFEESFLYNSIKNKCKVINGDVRDKKLLQSLLGDVDYLIHLASETGTGQSMYEINRYTDVNLMGLSNILETIMNTENRIKKIVLSSSRSVYGEGMYHCEEHGVVYPSSRLVDDMKGGDFEIKCPLCNRDVSLLKTKESCLLTPISYYAFTKMAQEKMLEVMCPNLDIPYTIFRYQNVYGSGQSLSNPYTGILSIFSKLLLSNKPLNIFEDGYESRDFVHVSDVADITCNALINDKTNNEIINVGNGIETTVMEVAESLKNIYGSDSAINVSGDFRKGDIKSNVADISKAQNLCSFTPRYDFENGILEFAIWVKSEVNGEISDEDYVKSIDELRAKGMLIEK